MFLTHPFPNNSASLQNQDFSFLLGWFCGFFFLWNFIKFCKSPLQEVLICIWNMLALKKKEEVNLAQSVIIQSPPKITVSKEIVPFLQMSNLCRHDIFTTLTILILKTKQNKTKHMLHRRLCCCLLQIPGDPDFAQGVNKALKNIYKCCQVKLCCCPLQVPGDKKFL